jgi:hypothetical protein
MRYTSLFLVFNVATTATKNTKVIPYERLNNTYANEGTFNSYGTLDNIRLLDIELSAVDREYQQQWTSKNIPTHRSIETELLKVRDSAKEYINLAQCNNNKGHTVLCDQLLARHQWLHLTVLRTKERILYRQHKAVTDGYAKILESKEIGSFRYEAALFLTMIVCGMCIDTLMRQWGWGWRAGD